jgi:hypothetical protein
MPHHADKSPSALAHGPAKAEDIERARRDLGTAETRVTRALLAERAYLSELHRTMSSDVRPSRSTARAIADQGVADPDGKAASLYLGPWNAR